MRLLVSFLFLIAFGIAGCGASVFMSSGSLPNNFIYRVSSSSDTLYYAYVNSNGKLSEQSSIALTTGCQPSDLAVTPDHNFLYVSCKGTNTVLTYLFDRNSGIPDYAYSVSRGSGSPLQVAVHPNGDFLYDMLDKSIEMAVLDTTTGYGTATYSYIVGSVGGYQAFAISPSGDYLYQAAAESGITEFSVNSTTGQLTLINIEAAYNAQTAMRVNPANSMLYVANSADGDILNFAIDGTGLLSLTSTESTGETTANYDLVFDADGSHLYTVNYAADKLLSFDVDASTGALSLLNSVSLPTGCGPKTLSLAARGNFLYTGCTDSSGLTYGYAIKSTGDIDTTAITSTVSGMTTESILAISF
jgi:6-phosphogluconolactonase